MRNSELSDNSVKMRLPAKLLPWLLALYLALFLSVIVSFHHHADRIDHRGDCAICALNHQPLIVDQAIQLALSILILSFIISGHVFLETSRREYLHLRSPPAF
jgi:hypothetical protein